MTQGIYCIENKTTGRKYYGSSINIEKRLDSHKKHLLQETHHNILLQRAVVKYGLDDFTFVIVEETSYNNRPELLLHEQTYLDKNVGGFNMAPANGGDLISNHPNKQEIILKRSAAVRNTINNMPIDERQAKYGRNGKNNGMYGRKHSTGSKEKMSQNLKGKYLGDKNHFYGKTHSDETKKKISSKMTGRMVGESNPFYGKTHSEETKKKISEYQKEHNWTKGKSAEEIPYTKKYELTYPDGSNSIIYGLKELAEYFKCSIANVKHTIDRMNKGSLPSKRSVFYNHLIKIVD